MSEVERIFDRFIDAFAEDLIALARDFIDYEVERAVAVAEAAQAKVSKAELRAQRRAERLAQKERLLAEKRAAREQKRAARLAEKDRKRAEKAAERAERQAEHDRLKQERLALKQELEAERRRLREATRKRPVKQLPLDFDGLRTPSPRRKDQPAPGSPPPLFVVKRRRDGQIEKLARDQLGSESSPGNHAKRVAKDMNGDHASGVQNGASERDSQELTAAFTPAAPPAASGAEAAAAPAE
jgi:multidrug efflux pump subunit AcrA (membrane-fusion protein)